MVGQDNPPAEVQSVVIYNDKDAAGRWIPLRIEVGSWVTLKPATRGPWAKDARVHGEESFAGAWKAQILRFQFHASTVRGRVVHKLAAIEVRHAYQRRQLELDPVSSANEPRACNYLYASYWDDLVPPSSVLDVILVLHHEIGEAGRNGRSHRQLLENGTFFLRAVYVPRSGSELYGSLEALPLPKLSDIFWPVPDMHTSEAFRAKMAHDIAAAMKGGTGSKVTHVQWFLPVHIMADLFAVADDIRRTPAMYVFRSPSAALLASLMDPGWDEKWQSGQDIIKCVVSRGSVRFRYHLARQVLYVNFCYVRYRREGQQWVAMDQTVIPDMVKTEVVFRGEVLPAFEVGEPWPVSQIRNEIAILLPRDVIPDYYDLVIERPGRPDRKVVFFSHIEIEFLQTMALICTVCMNM